MMSSVVPARLEFQCGHAALVSLPRVKGESSAQRTDRIRREKTAAQVRSCDFCPPPRLELVAPTATAAAPLAPVTRLDPPVALPVAPITRLDPPVALPVAPVVGLDPPAAPVVRSPRRVRSVAQPVAAVPAAPAPVAAVPAAPTPVAAEPVAPAPVAVVPASPATVAAVPVSPAPLAPPVRRVGRPRRTPTPVAAAQTARYQFLVRFQTETVVHAADIRDALRQAESLGATDVLAITSHA